jgi:hypothetical protein
MEKNPDEERRATCLLWTGALAKGGGRRNREYPGYPIFQTSSLRPKTQKAHRLAYQLKWGPIPSGMQVQHSCNEPRCCNPYHLKVGTPAKNSAYMVFCGRAATGLRHGRGKLSNTQVEEILALCQERTNISRQTKGNGNSAIYADIGAQFGVSESHVRNIHHGRRGRSHGS